MKPGRLLVFVASISVAVVAYAAAAALGTGAGTLQSGNAVVASCQASGFTFTNTLSGTFVASVAVGGITAACQSGALTLNLDDSSGASLGSGTATIPASCSGCSVSVSLSPQPLATSVVADSLVVRGP